MGPKDREGNERSAVHGAITEGIDLRDTELDGFLSHHKLSPWRSDDLFEGDW